MTAKKDQENVIEVEPTRLQNLVVRAQSVAEKSRNTRNMTSDRLLRAFGGIYQKRELEDKDKEVIATPDIGMISNSIGFANEDLGCIGCWIEEVGGTWPRSPESEQVPETLVMTVSRESEELLSRAQTVREAVKGFIEDLCSQGQGGAHEADSAKPDGMLGEMHARLDIVLEYLDSIDEFMMKL